MDGLFALRETQPNSSNVLVSIWTVREAHFIINAVRWLATVAASTNSLVIWDVATKTGSRVYSFLHAEAELSSLEWSTNEKYLVTLCRFSFCVTHTYLF